MNSTAETDFNKLLSSYFAFIYSYLVLFPQASWAAYGYIIRLTNWMAKLSPKAQQLIMKTLIYIQSAAVALYGWYKQIYPKFMALGNRPLENWKQHSRFILWPVATFAVFILPVNTVWATDLSESIEIPVAGASEGDSNLSKDAPIYVGNSNVLGLDCLSVMCQIYLKTKLWPRLVVDELHFKIPFWKHLIESFGAVKYTQKIVVSLNDLNHCTLVCSDALLELPSKVISYGSVGIEDMVKVLYKIPYNPNNVAHTLSIVAPVSYERQYLTFGSSSAVVYLSPTINTLVLQSKKRRESEGDKRYLLQFVGKSLRAVKENLFKNNGIVHRGAKWVWGSLAAGTATVLKYAVARLEKVDDKEE